MQNTNWIKILVGLIVLGGIAFLVFGRKDARAPVTENPAGTVEQGSPDAEDMGPAGTMPRIENDGGTYTPTQVALHATREDCWTIVNGNVYDLTAWISQHPGGAAAIIQLCGKDGSEKFNGQHGGMQKQAETLATFKIGIAAQ